MKQVLITGGTGFAGNALARRLLEESIGVKAAVRSVECIERLPDGVDVVPVGPIGPDTDWSDALKDVGTVVHLAAAVPKPGTFDQNDMHSVNVLGSRRLAQAAAAAGATRLIFISSIEVYGKETIGEPFSEDDATNPETGYGSSKMEAECQLAHVANEAGLDLVILRVPIIYGQNRTGSTINLLRSLISKGMPLPVASVNNRRSYVHVDNLADAILMFCRNEDLPGEIYNVSDEPGLSTRELAGIVAAAMGREAHIVSLPRNVLRLASIGIGKKEAVKLLTSSYSLDSSKIRMITGWESPIPLEEGISVALGRPAVTLPRWTVKGGPMILKLSVGTSIFAPFIIELG
ncbi:MAG: NAD-dependent epimerase/dehydratase family protein [Thermoleophilia bacterium]